MFIRAIKTNVCKDFIHKGENSAAVHQLSNKQNVTLAQWNITC